MALAFALLLPAAAQAVPVLQLDIGNGTYAGGDEESIVTSDPQFTLYAIGTPSGNVSESELLSTTYYISIALIPQSGPVPVDFGSFVIDGVTYTIADMIYGAAPYDAFSNLFDAGDLSKHGIFETFYLQISFTFDPGDTTGTYNTMDDAGSGPQPGNGSFFHAFDIIVSGMLPGFNLHFDLYSTKVVGGGWDVDRDDFAPFSHDARTVPEPGTLGLLGIGLLALGFARRRRVDWR